MASLGYAVVCAVSGRAAIDLIRDGEVRPSLAILDLNMPEFDGETTFAELRRLRQDLPVLICSGQSAECTVARLLALGAIGFLPRPADQTELAVAVAVGLAGTAEAAVEKRT